MHVTTTAVRPWTMTGSGESLWRLCQRAQGWKPVARTFPIHIAEEHWVLGCSKCERMMSYTAFSRRTRLLGGSFYNDNVALFDEDRQRFYDVMFCAVVSEKWRCRACGERLSVEHARCRLSQALSQHPCRTCCYPLVESPPGKRYLRNHHGSFRRSVRNRACRRCLAGAPPPWSVALRLSARDWRDFPDPLPLVIKTLALSTIYDVPWNGGLCKIALFLGELHCRERRALPKARLRLPTEDDFSDSD